MLDVGQRPSREALLGAPASTVRSLRRLGLIHGYCLQGLADCSNGSAPGSGHLPVARQHSTCVGLWSKKTAEQGKSVCRAKGNQFANTVRLVTFHKIPHEFSAESNTMHELRRRVPARSFPLKCRSCSMRVIKPPHIQQKPSGADIS